MLGFPEANKRGNYKLPERIRTKREIYQMILDGYSYVRIMQELNISERTLYRYLDIIFEEERDLLDGMVWKEEMRRQFIICRDRLIEDRQEVKQWLKDPNFKDKVAAMNLASELAVGVSRIYSEGPGIMSRYQSLPENARVLRLQLRKDRRAAERGEQAEEGPDDIEIEDSEELEEQEEKKKR